MARQTRPPQPQDAEVLNVMTKQLWNFQRADVDLLASKRSCLIANEMGTGKTPTAVELDKVRREVHKTVTALQANNKTLVVCPLSVVDVWVQHFKDWNPALRVRAINPKKRELLLADLDFDVAVVHWDALRLMPELAAGPVNHKVLGWFHIIADEAHRAKNRNAKQTKSLKKIRAVYKTALTGTPMINAPHELWSILNWLYPKDYKAYWKFYNKHVDYVVIPPQGYHKIIGPRNEKELQEAIKPFYVRHRKKAKCCEHHPLGVTPDLPEKYYTTLEVDLHPIQRTAYQQMKKELVAWVGENQDVPLVAPIVIAQLTRLSQFSVAYATVTDTGNVSLAEPSSKLDMLMELIEDSPDEQFVVFSQFSQLIDLLEQRLRGYEIPYTKLTGDVPEQQRRRGVEEFQAGNKRIFIGTIAAGGVGITLTSASTVVFLDRAWSPALNSQAEDRLHRMGQKNPVHVIDIVAKRTVDLGRKARLEIKEEWIRKMLGDE